MTNFSNQQLQSARNISNFSDMFWNTYRLEPPKNPKESLEQFLLNYSFERQGSPRAYRTIAKRALDELFNDGVLKITEKETKKGWELCLNIRNRLYPNLNLNETHHPLRPDKGVLKRLEEKNVIDIFEYISSLLSNNDKQKAYRFIFSVRGVGHKITALYLRDIAYFQLSPEEHFSTYFQPIDTWIDQAIDIISRINKIKMPPTKQAKRQFIVNLCMSAKCNPIEFNAGAWYAGSIIAQDYGTFQKIILDKNEAINLVKQRIKEREKAINAMRNWMK